MLVGRKKTNRQNNTEGQRSACAELCFLHSSLCFFPPPALCNDVVRQTAELVRSAKASMTGSSRIVSSGMSEPSGAVVT